ncbi:MAG TPA: YfhO family protein, partial [Anaerolineae bacterium]|nr:YfhO family protein [Anaerolineae bacterium]
ERITVEAETACPGYLVLSDAHYPGWVALVDGRPEEIRRANFYFRAVFVRPGHHLIEFVYQPTSVKVGLALSLAAALVVVGGFAWERLRGWPSTC